MTKLNENNLIEERSLLKWENRHMSEWHTRRRRKGGVNLISFIWISCEEKKTFFCVVSPTLSSYKLMEFDVYYYELRNPPPPTKVTILLRTVVMNSTEKLNCWLSIRFINRIKQSFRCSVWNEEILSKQEWTTSYQPQWMPSSSLYFCNSRSPRANNIKARGKPKETGQRREGKQINSNNKQMIIYIPIEWDGNQCEDRYSNSYITHKHIHRTMNAAKWPVRIEHIDEIEHTV